MDNDSMGNNDSRVGVVDLFCGGGLFCLGAKRADAVVLFGVDANPHFKGVFEANFGAETFVNRTIGALMDSDKQEIGPQVAKNVRNIAPRTFAKLVVKQAKKRRVDIVHVHASPSCKEFSIASSSRKRKPGTWGGATMTMIATTMAVFEAIARACHDEALEFTSSMEESFSIQTTLNKLGYKIRGATFSEVLRPCDYGGLQLRRRAYFGTGWTIPAPSPPVPPARAPAPPVASDEAHEAGFARFEDKFPRLGEIARHLARTWGICLCIWQTTNNNRNTEGAENHTPVFNSSSRGKALPTMVRVGALFWTLWQTHQRTLSVGQLASQSQESRKKWTLLSGGMPSIFAADDALSQLPMREFSDEEYLVYSDAADYILPEDEDGGATTLAQIATKGIHASLVNGIGRPSTTKIAGKFILDIAPKARGGGYRESKRTLALRHILGNCVYPRFAEMIVERICWSSDASSSSLSSLGRRRLSFLRLCKPLRNISIVSEQA